MTDRARVDAHSGVRILGDVVDYADGSEDLILDVLTSAGDLSSASDELAHHIADWPSRYHLSRTRANLLRPLDLRAGMRVLDVGAGSGALTRHLGETGADVVALEGSLQRARAVAARCEGLDNVEVLCGRVEDLDDPEAFDVVVCVGVLEYARTGALPFLRRLRACTRDDGALVLAIENQLGLKYLLGYAEDHLGEPWVGVEGYSPTSEAKTLSRRRLERLIGDADFPAQRWAFPFPDYKLPSVIVDASAYAQDDAHDFVDQIVRWPCSPEASAPLRLCDDRRAHRVFLQAGLGQDVANSFLVVAASRPADHDRLLDPEAAAWFFGSDRLSMWLRSKTFRSDGATSSVRATPVSPADRPPERGWLRQLDSGEQARVAGKTVEQMVLEACPTGADAVGAALFQWRRHLRAIEVEVGPEAPGPSHPFRSADTSALLPADHVDVNLSNFVMDRAGALHYVDAEWATPSGVDADMVCTRALWWLAAELVTRGVTHPWSPSSTVDELTEALGLLCDTAATAATIDRWRQSEALLQSKVGDRPVDECLRWLEDVGRTSQTARTVVRHLPFRTLRHNLAVVHEHVKSLGADLELAREQVTKVVGQLAAEHKGRTELAKAAEEDRRQLNDLVEAERRQAAALTEQVNALTEQAREAARRWEAFEERSVVRLYRRLQRLTGRR